MQQNSIQLLRHASLVLKMGKNTILIDPMFSAKDEMDPVLNCGNDIRIPMTELPIDETTLAKLLNEIDAVVITHLHRDHWDTAAQNLLSKNKQIFCQPADTEKIESLGFFNVRAIDDGILWKNIVISRTAGQHGTGEIGKKMGKVSGFVFNDGRQSVYVAGDTIWCNDVEEALDVYKPDVIVVNAGAAQFLSGDPITMTPQDIINVHSTAPTATLIAVHMDTVNHCLVKRDDLERILAANNLLPKVIIPADGETIFL